MTDDADPDRPAPTREPARVARFDELDPATADRPRVADFGDLDADGGRPLAPVIRLDSLATRRGARRTPGGAPSDTSGSIPDDGAEPRAPGRGDRSSQTRSPQTRSARSPWPWGATEAESAEEGRPAGGASRAERAGPGDGVPPDGIPLDGIPSDGPLPRGRRRRARTGRLGPDAPDPELPLPEADPVAIAREICLRLLTDRARTRQELAQALTRKGVPEEAAATVLDRFAEVGLIDDVAFAGQWVRSRHTHRGLGRRAIAVELRRKGVADGVAQEALAEVDPESEDRRARDLVDRKLRSLTVDTPEQRAKAAQRLVGMLARKGYGAGTAYRVVREALAEHGADTDELGTDLDH